MSEMPAFQAPKVPGPATLLPLSPPGPTDTPRLAGSSGQVSPGHALVGTTPLCDLEIQLSGAEGGRVRDSLTKRLAAELEALNQRKGDPALDRETFGITEAYSEAIKAALSFLARWYSRS